jgi:hypothetical protein
MAAIRHRSASASKQVLITCPARHSGCLLPDWRQLKLQLAMVKHPEAKILSSDLNQSDRCSKSLP